MNTLPMADVDDPLLGYFRKDFDWAYIALHPFVTVEGLHPLNCEYRTPVFLRSELPKDQDLLQLVAQVTEENSRSRKLGNSEVDAMISQRGVAHSWVDLASALDFTDYREINRALRTSIHGLRRDLEDIEAADRLITHTVAKGIFVPTEGGFQAIMRVGLAKLFAAHGPTVTVLDEHDIDDPQQVSVDMLRDGEIPYHRGRVLSEDLNLRAETPWDDFFTVIVGKNGTESRRLLHHLFEGFWATEQTTIGAWFLEPLEPIASVEAQ